MCACVFDMPRGPSLCATRLAGRKRLAHRVSAGLSRRKGAGIVTARRTNRSAAAAGPCVSVCVYAFVRPAAAAAAVGGSRDGLRCRADDVQQQQQHQHQQQQLSERGAAAAAERSSAVIMPADRRAAGEKSLTQVWIRDSQRRG